MNIRVNSIETLGALDGPGIRTVIFFQGCPMRCAYCHNADALNPDGGEKKTVAELIAFVLRYKNYFGGSGGVTLSGGEPLLQRCAALELMRALKSKGIRSALDTCGCMFAPDALDEADLVILDIKHSDPEKFFELTGHSAENTFKTLEYLKKNDKRFWIRQVILNGFTDGAEQIKALRNMTAGAERTELLPFHNMGGEKWERAGFKYRLKGAAPPSAETMDRLNKILHKENANE
jgi:pyruvate formate lyase activating enzyme